MIYFYCLGRNSHPLSRYLTARWPRADGARIRRIDYAHASPSTLRPGLHIFADIELLEGDSLARAIALHTALRARPQDCVIWNNPARSARRFEVLDHLARQGANRFHARRVEGAEPPADLRYPLFFRDEHEHLGPLTPPLPDATAARSALAALRADTRPHQPLLAVEYLDYAEPDGVFRKYSCFRLGPRFEPRHVFFSRQWVLKYSDPAFAVSPWREEEQRFLASRDHHDELIGIFNTLAIDYGRVDYAVVDGRVQVFEINTNPMIVQREQLRRDPRSAVHRAFGQRFADALVAADPGPAPSVFARLSWLASPLLAFTHRCARRLRRDFLRLPPVLAVLHRGKHG